MTSIDLGGELPRPTPSPELHERLSTRRSASAQQLHAPGPDEVEVEAILTLGARTLHVTAFTDAGTLEADVPLGTP